MSVKTPGGKTERVKMDEIVMQGSVRGPLLCTGTMDKIGKKAYKTGATLYKYKGLVSVPPLGMVDDELTMAECGAQSTLTNAMINNFTESKKLKLRIKKYIGDVISADGYNTANIKERCDKGYGIANEIISILKEIPLGPYKVSVGLKLREAMLLNGVLLDSEIWFNLKDNEIQKLSDIDKHLLRSILGRIQKKPLSQAAFH